MRSRILMVTLVGLAVAACPLIVTAQPFNQVVVIQPVKHDTSPQLNDLLPGPVSPGRHVIPLYKPGSGPGGGGGGGGSSFTDPVWQSSANSSSNAVLGFARFNGLGADSDAYAPPDTNGAAGTYQYVQTVNVDLETINKSSGAVVYGPVPIDTLWSGFGGSCATNNGGDPIVQFDKINNRWVVMQIQYSGFGGGGGNYLCIAVSNGDDWTTNFSWNRYAYKFNTLTDYPKMGIWTDGYYVTFNAFKGFGTFAGPVACALDAATMRAGGNASVQCISLSTSYFSLLPADIDSASQLPLSGEPEYLAGMGNPLWTWRFHVDWNNSANTTLRPAQAVLVSSTTFSKGLGFQQACGGGTCIPQSDTTQQLDSLGDRLMYRLAYRNFGAYESLVVNQSVTPSSTSSATGIRWYELRNTPSTNYQSPTAPSVYQAGTYGPNDGSYRWMGSAAMDANGNMAVGYSVSSSSMHPAIRVAARCSGDTAGQLGSEAVVQAGTGSQNGNLSRWGDYSSMSIDPNGSLWFTTEYLTSDGSFNWHTAIANLSISGCP